MPTFELSLLGTFRLTQDRSAVPLEQDRLIELIGLIALSPGGVLSRQKVAHTFWSDSREKQARANVRRLIHRLKEVWPDAEEAIELGRHELCWRNQNEIDVHRFEAAVNAASENGCPSDQAISILTQAADLYQGDLLPDLYSDWVLVERERLGSLYSQCLAMLSDRLLDTNQPEEALEWAKQLQRFAPLREASYRRLMKIYAALNDRAAALRIFHICADTLAQELGVEPGPATQALYRRLIAREKSVADAQPSAAPGPAVATSKLIGRGAEWQQILARWRAAQQGKPGVIAIFGEAGIGKTRLAEELLRWVDRQGHAWASSRSYAAQGGLSYAPIADWLSAPHLRTRLDTIEDLWRVEVGRLCPDLLTARPDLPRPGPIREDWQRRRFYEGMRHAFLDEEAPILLHLDDLQWTDAQTLDALAYLCQAAGERPLLLLTTIRSEESHKNPALAPFLNGLRRADQLLELTLSPLSQEACRALADQTALYPLSEDDQATLFARSEGHPLFLIETVRAGSQNSAGQSPLSPQHEVSQASTPTIPDKIYRVIDKRLSGLSETAQHLAAVAAVIGREFSYPVLHGASDQNELVLVDALDELWQQRIVREQGETAYDFSHDRIREVAYARISQARRRLLHGKVARSLEDHHRGGPDAVAVELARHHEQARNVRRALTYYEQAGDVASAQYAMARAEEMYRAALRLASDTDLVRQFTLRQKLCHLYEHYSNLEAWQSLSDEQHQLLNRLLDEDALSQEEKERYQIAYWLDRTSLSQWIKEDGEVVLVNCRQILPLAKKHADLNALSLLYLNMGYALWSLSDMSTARGYFLQSVAYAQQAENQDIEIASLEYAAATGWFRGMSYKDVLALLERALALATAQNNLPRLASIFNKYGYSEIFQGTGNFEKAAEYYQRALGYAREFDGTLLTSSILRNVGHLEACRGGYRAADAAIHEAQALAESLPDDLHTANAMHHRAFSLIQQGDFEQAESVLTEAEARVQNVGFYHFQAKLKADFGLLYHLRGKERKALSVLKQGLAMASRHGDARYQGILCVRLGYGWEALDRPEEAERWYCKGLTYHRQMEQTYFAAYAQAGLARLAQKADALVQAETLARRVWTAMSSQEPEATIETARIFATCIHIFASRDPALAATITRMAQEQLRRRAASIDDPQRQAAFWNLPDHRAILSLA